MRLERHPIRVSHETIYRFVCSKDGPAEQFYHYLPENRRPREHRRHHLSHIFESPNLQPPKRIAERIEFDHWKRDLMTC